MAKDQPSQKPFGLAVLSSMIELNFIAGQRGSRPNFLPMSF
jgi:hypothetical protein